MGGLPLFFAFSQGGASEVLKTSESLLPPKLLIVYLSILTVGYFAIECANWFLYKGPSTAAYLFRPLRSVLSEVGTGVLSMLRIVGGILLIYPVLWFYAEPSSFKQRTAIHFFTLGCLAIAESAAVSWAHKFVAERWSSR
jgi:hypothetical protein